MIKSNLLAELSPSILSIKNLLGQYSGIFISEALRVKHSGSAYTEFNRVKRIFCSCGYEGTNLNNTCVCPSCGGQLLGLEHDRRNTNTFTNISMISEVNGNVLDTYEISISISPIRVASADDTDILNLKTFKLDFARVQLDSCEKLSGNIFKNTHLFGGISSYRKPWCTPEILDFFGDKIIFVTSDLSYEKLKNKTDLKRVYITLDSEKLKANAKFPNVFTPDLMENKRGLADDVFHLIIASSMSKVNKKLPTNISLEDFLDKHGFPLSVLPENFESGRPNLRLKGKDLKDFFDSNIGQIVHAKIMNGDEVSHLTVNEMIELYKSFKSKKTTEFSEEFFISFLRDTVDQYGFNKIIPEFNHRMAWLSENGIAINEDNIRTKKFYALKNSKLYCPKKIVDIEVSMQNNPLETLKSLMVYKSFI